MKKFQKIALCALLAVSLIIVSGCAQFDVNLRINTDKSADLNFVFMVSNMMVSMGNGKTGLEDIKKEAISQGFSAKDVKQKDMTGFQFSKHLTSIDALQSGVNTKTSTKTDTNTTQKASIFTQPFDVKKNSKLYQIKKGFFKDVYTFDTSLNLSDLAADKLNLGSEKDEMTKAILQNVIAQMDFNFNLELPVKTISNNATKVSADGKKLSWNLKAGDTNSIQLSFYAWNVGHIMMAVAIFLAVFIFLMALLIKRSRKRKLRGIVYKREENLLMSDNEEDMFVSDTEDAEAEVEENAEDLPDETDLLGEKMAMEKQSDVLMDNEKEPLSNTDDTENSDKETKE